MVKLVPAINMNMIIVHWIILLYAPILWLWVEKPAVAIVVKEWQKESNHDIPSIFNINDKNKTKPMYINLGTRIENGYSYNVWKPNFITKKIQIYSDN